MFALSIVLNWPIFSQIPILWGSGSLSVSLNYHLYLSLTLQEIPLNHPKSLVLLCFLRQVKPVQEAQKDLGATFKSSVCWDAGLLSSPFCLDASPYHPALELTLYMHTANITVTQSRYSIHNLLQGTPNPSYIKQFLLNLKPVTK